ncbi:MAG: DUF167 domain-containing protein [Candidatus Omnitrophica bacterium]|nr:DUF167 domain-containing protein [Candidatus Omnitrophota bacterium]MDD5437272.1 DUF167 domain-containing protein [Candidatus Omnitrophota bacterium]
MVRISVKVKPGSKQDSVEAAGEGQYTVRVKERAIEGRANDAVIRLLSEYFDVPKSSISIVRGIKGKLKMIALKTLS